MIARRRWILVLLFWAAYPPFTFTAEKPNILVIFADDLGYGDLACQGAKDMKTPHIDALFDQGMTFTHFYANSSVCSPTRAALLSGRYPELVGVPGVIRTHAKSSWGHLTPDAVLLPKLLKQAGYHTAIIGKWHLGLKAPNRPNDRGFDFFHGFLGDMMDDYHNHRRHGINYMRLNGKKIDPKGHATDLFSKWAVDYIRKRRQTGKSAPRKKPFFLNLAYNAPHTPIQPPKEWLAKVQEREPDISPKRAKLVALIEHMDHGIGQVLDALKQSGEYDNTLIIFTSDNGGQLGVGARNGPIRDGKGSMYEGGLRVPTCFMWKGHITPDSKSNVVAISMDLCPTICAAAGAGIKHKIEGVSLLPIVTGKEKTLPDRDLFFIRREGGRYKGQTIHALRSGDWKVVMNMPNVKLEMYHLGKDSKETRNLRASDAKTFKRLADLLRDHIKRGNAVPWQPPERRKVDSKN